MTRSRDRHSRPNATAGAIPGRTEVDFGWAVLRRFTPARIGLARTGVSIATAPLLEFRRAHAAARDAVWQSLDRSALEQRLTALEPPPPVLAVTSRATTRRDYLLRPDLGRTLSRPSAELLSAHAGDFDLAIIVIDGLSAQAAERHAVPLLIALLPLLGPEWRLAPLVIAEHGRVALGDAICRQLGAICALVLIGERPGLSSPDSLGAYLTWRPEPQTTDEARNCVSNIRPEGLAYDPAAHRLAYLLRMARSRQLSGVALKDLSQDLPSLSVRD
jgi:ethanolamine ammonia-lyase small subunit